MSIDGTSQTSFSSGSTTPPSSPRRSGWGRVVFYLVLVALLGGIGWRVWVGQKAAQKLAADQSAATQSRPVPVQVSAVEERAMPIYNAALGTVTPYMSVTVKARVSGELLPVKFVEGQQVRAGETILNIDPKPYKAALDQAKGTLAHDQALLKNAQAEYKRYKALYDAGVTSKESLDADEASLGQYEGAIAADKAAVETAQLQLSWCSIQSPISGKIGLRLVDPGNIITANTTSLVVINQIQPIAVNFTLPEGQLPVVLRRLLSDKRLPVEAWDRGDTQKLADGYLLAADNQIDTTTGTARLKAVFENHDQSLFPNQFVNVHLVLENRAHALVVPSAAIQSGLQGNFVWGIQADAKGAATAKMLPIKVALSEGQNTIVDSGLTAGDKIVVDGADRLRDNAPVTVSQPRNRGVQSSAPNAGSLFSNGASGAAPSGKSANDHSSHAHKEQQ